MPVISAFFIHIRFIKTVFQIMINDQNGVNERSDHQVDVQILHNLEENADAPVIVDEDFPEMLPEGLVLID